jgi:hypothetical protein
LKARLGHAVRVAQLSNALAFHPRNPQHEINTGQAKDGRAR